MSKPQPTTLQELTLRLTRRPHPLPQAPDDPGGILSDNGVRVWMLVAWLIYSLAIGSCLFLAVLVGLSILDAFATINGVVNVPSEYLYGCVAVSGLTLALWGGAERRRLRLLAPRFEQWRSLDRTRFKLAVLSLLIRGGYEILESPASHTVLRRDSVRICLTWLYLAYSYTSTAMAVKLEDRFTLVQASDFDECMIVSNCDSLRLHKESMFKRRCRLRAFGDLVEFELTLEHGTMPAVRWI